MGAPARTPAESQLEEAVALDWRPFGAASAAGSVSTAATTSSQASTQAPHPRTRSRSGSGRSRRRLALTGRVADGWVSPLMSYKRRGSRPGKPRDRSRRPRGGPRPARIRRIYNVQGAFTDTSAGPPPPHPTSASGPPEHWAEVLSTSRSTSASAPSCSPPRPARQTLATFIEDVAPRVRERVAERAPPLAAPAVPGSRSQ